MPGGQFTRRVQVPKGPCQVALVDRRPTPHNEPVAANLETTRAELTIAVLLSAGVLVAGLYDWQQGAPPETLLPMPSTVRLVGFVVAVIAGAALAGSVRGRGNRSHC